jgi:hypothetical protein
MLKRLCGDDAARNVVLVTTKWRNVTRSLGNEREQRLRKEWWNSLLDQGSRVARFEETRGSAWHIINLIVEKHPTRGASPDTEFTKWPFFTTQPPTFPSMTAPGKSNPKAEIIDDPTLMDIIILCGIPLPQTIATYWNFQYHRHNRFREKYREMPVSLNDDHRLIDVLVHQRCGRGRHHTCESQFGIQHEGNCVCRRHRSTRS